jgi:hypothetical protein
MTACMLGKRKGRGVGSQLSNDNAPDIPHLGRQALSHHHFISDVALRDFAIDNETRSERSMSELGHKQTSRSQITMSAIPPKADIPR